MMSLISGDVFYCRFAAWRLIMEKQKLFSKGVRYSGEKMYGGCGCIDTNSITVLKRFGNSITYQENFGKANEKIRDARIETIGNWGEYITVNDDRFFAYAIENWDQYTTLGEERFFAHAALDT